MKVFNLLTLTALLITLASCGNDKVVYEDKQLDTPTQAKVKSAIKSADEMLYNLENRRVYSSASASTKKELLKVIDNVKRILQRINSFGVSVESIQALNYQVKTLSEEGTIFTSQRDDALINEYTDQVNSIIFELAKGSGIDLDQIPWTLWTTRFVKSGQFTTSNEGRYSWNFGFSSTIPVVRIRDDRAENKAWLVAPIMDLSKVDNPYIQLNQSITIEENFRERKVALNKANIRKKAFKVLVSTKYKNGDPNNDIYEWTNVANDEFFKTNKIDLSAYTNNKHVSVAFLFDKVTAKNELGTHFAGWEIEEFKLMGKSNAIKIVTDRPEKQNIYANSFDNLKDVTVAGSHNWVPGNYRDKNYALARYSRSEDGSVNPHDMWMITKPFNIANDKLKLTLLETVNTSGRAMDANEQSKFSVKVSADYEAGKDPKDFTWVELTGRFSDKCLKAHSERNTKYINCETVFAFSDSNGNPTALADFIGKDVSFAFNYINETGDNRTWQVDDFIVSGDGADIFED